MILVRIFGRMSEYHRRFVIIDPLIQEVETALHVECAILHRPLVKFERKASYACFFFLFSYVFGAAQAASCCGQDNNPPSVLSHKSCSAANSKHSIIRMSPNDKGTLRSRKAHNSLIFIFNDLWLRRRVITLTHTKVRFHT
jgi:hypothetical protein